MQLPGLVQAVRGFEPIYAKPAERLLEAGSIAGRSKNPGTIVEWVDNIGKATGADPANCRV